MLPKWHEDTADSAALREQLQHVYWIGGGSGAGKSTIARRIAAQHGLRVYATDDVMADHARRSTREDSPLLHRFMAMDMDERWVNRPAKTLLETFHWFQGEGFNLNLPLRESLRAAANLGAKGVQFDVREELKPGELADTGRRQLLHAIDELGLSIASLAFPMRRSFYDEEQLDGRVAAAKRALDHAWQLRARVLTVRIGKVPTDKESKPYQLLFDVLSDLAMAAERSR
jgi:hypothetical protein